MDLEAKAHLKTLAADAIADVLSEIERQEREPDLWERADLVMAISLLFRGAYSHAAILAIRADTPPEQRSPHAVLREEPAYDLKTLRAALREAVAEPLRAWPHLGPIVFGQEPRA